MLAGGAVFVEPEATAAMAGAIRELARDRAARARLGVVLRRSVRALDRDEVLARAVAHIEPWRCGQPVLEPQVGGLAVTHAD
jgi:hypothetical protein